MTHRTAIVLATLVSLGVVTLLVPRLGSAQDASRYPYDPVCPWGRIANGSGMLVRCVTEAEASALLSSSCAVAKAAPSASGSAAPSPSAPPPPAVETTAKELSVKVGPVTPDQGKLPAAEKKLSLAKDRFASCVADNGGLQSDEGEVHVRFLVGDRGRAEGVSVAKRVGVGEKAARCVADVVDRRWVGTPEAPMLGATAVVKFSKVKK